MPTLTISGSLLLSSARGSLTERPAAVGCADRYHWHARAARARRRRSFRDLAARRGGCHRPGVRSGARAAGLPRFVALQGWRGAFVHGHQARGWRRSRVSHFALAAQRWDWRNSERCPWRSHAAKCETRHRARRVAPRGGFEPPAVRSGARAAGLPRLVALLARGLVLTLACRLAPLACFSAPAPRDAPRSSAR